MLVAGAAGASVTSAGDAAAEGCSLVGAPLESLVGEPAGVEVGASLAGCAAASLATLAPSGAIVLSALLDAGSSVGRPGVALSLSDLAESAVLVAGELVIGTLVVVVGVAGSSVGLPLVLGSSLLVGVVSGFGVSAGGSLDASPGASLLIGSAGAKLGSTAGDEATIGDSLVCSPAPPTVVAAKVELVAPSDLSSVSSGFGGAIGSISAGSTGWLEPALTVGCCC